MNFIWSVHGFIDLISRGFIYKLSDAKNDPNIIAHINESIEQLDISSDRKTEFMTCNKPSPLIVELALKRHDSSLTEVDIKQLSHEVFNECLYLLDAINNSASILLISAYACTKDYDDQNDPIWNFFYHCRNACAHNNRFKIVKKRFPAKWRSLEITLENNRSQVFKGSDDVGLLYPGDAVLLLWDIEQKYSSMLANPSRVKSNSQIDTQGK